MSVTKEDLYKARSGLVMSYVRQVLGNRGGDLELPLKQRELLNALTPVLGADFTTRSLSRIMRSNGWSSKDTSRGVWYTPRGARNRYVTPRTIVEGHIDPYSLDALQPAIRHLRHIENELQRRKRKRPEQSDIDICLYAIIRGYLKAIENDPGRESPYVPLEQLIQLGYTLHEALPPRLYNAVMRQVGLYTDTWRVDGQSIKVMRFPSAERTTPEQKARSLDYLSPRPETVPGLPPLMLELARLRGLEKKEAQDAELRGKEARKAARKAWRKAHINWHVVKPSTQCPVDRALVEIGRDPLRRHAIVPCATVLGLVRQRTGFEYTANYVTLRAKKRGITVERLQEGGKCGAYYNFHSGRPATGVNRSKLWEYAPTIKDTSND